MTIILIILSFQNEKTKFLSIVARLQVIQQENSLDTWEMIIIKESFVIGRKGWLFSDTPKGAGASAVVYSLVESAKANDLNPYSYLLRLLTELPMYDGQPAQQDIGKLMPWSDYIQKHCALP